MQEYIKCADYTFIKTNKYKENDIYLYFSLPYSLKDKCTMQLLSRILLDYSNKYPNKEKMLKAKDLLYDFDASCSVNVQGNLLQMLVHFSFIDPFYLQDVGYDDYLSFINELLYNPFFSEDIIIEVKRNYLSSLKRRFDKPAFLARNQMIKEIAREDDYFVAYDSDIEKTVNTINLSDVEELYDRLFKKARIDKYFIGQDDSLFKKFLIDLTSHSQKEVSNHHLCIDDIGYIEEKKDISQTYLHYCLYCPVDRRSKDFFAYNMGNVLFGLVPTSFLFSNIREKLSLCYQIGIIDFKNEGLVDIYTAIDARNSNLVVKEIEKELNRMITMDYSQEELEVARNLFAGEILSMNDNRDSLMEYYQNYAINGLNMSIDDYISNLMMVTKEDIARVFATYKHCITYVLKGSKDEKDC